MKYNYLLPLYTPFGGGFNEGEEERVRSRERGLEFRMELCTEEERVLGLGQLGIVRNEFLRQQPPGRRVNVLAVPIEKLRAEVFSRPRLKSWWRKPKKR